MTTKKTYRPLGYRVLVKTDQVAKQVGQIVIPETVREKEQGAQVRGTIVALGKDAFNDSEDSVKVGDTVMYQRYSGMRVVLEDGSFSPDLLLLNDRDLTCEEIVVPDEETE